MQIVCLIYLFSTPDQTTYNFVSISEMCENRLELPLLLSFSPQNLKNYVPQTTYFSLALSAFLNLSNFQTCGLHLSEFPSQPCSNLHWSRFLQIQVSLSPSYSESSLKCTDINSGCLDYFQTAGHYNTVIFTSLQVQNLAAAEYRRLPANQGSFANQQLSFALTSELYLIIIIGLEETLENF